MWFQAEPMSIPCRRLTFAETRARNQTRPAKLHHNARSAFHAYLHAGSIGKFALSQFDFAAANHPFEFLRGRWTYLDLRDSREAFVHGGIREPVGFLIVSAQNVADRKPFELRNQFLGAGVKVVQSRVPDFVNPFDLPHQQLRIADHLERLVAVFDRIFQRRDQPLILGEIVSLVAEIFAERGYFVTGFILITTP